MRTKSRARQIADRTRQRPRGTTFSPKTRPVPLTMATLDRIARDYLGPQIAKDIYGISPISRGPQPRPPIPISKQLLQDAWQ